MEKRPLHIPPGKKTTGLTVYCYRCNTDVGACKETGKPLPLCPFGNRHVFKVYAHVPGTKNKRKTKVLTTRDANEAIRQALAFEEEVKQGAEVIASDARKALTVPPDDVDTALPVSSPSEENKPRLLTHALARYIGWLHGEDVPAHRRRKGELSKEYMRDNASAFRLLVNCWSNRHLNMNTLEVKHINDEAVGYIYEELTEKKHYSGYTIKRVLGYYKAFLNWYAAEYDPSVKNWFEGVTREKLTAHPESITQVEYEALLERITPENGIKIYNGTVKKLKRNLHRPWLKDGIRLGLETGRRREEVCKLLFNQVFEENGRPAYIRVEDFKVNRIQKRLKEEEKRYIYIPVTDSLYELLLELGYDRYKGTDKYILSPEVDIDRKDVMPDTLSRGFSHYYHQLNTGRHLDYKCLRKTYITNLSIYLGDETKAVTRHSDDGVIELHYLDKAVIAKAAQGYDVWGNTNREDQLLSIRKNQDQLDRNELLK